MSINTYRDWMLLQRILQICLAAPVHLAVPLEVCRSCPEPVGFARALVTFIGVVFGERQLSSRVFAENVVIRFLHIPPHASVVPSRPRAAQNFLIRQFWHCPTCLFLILGFDS